MNSVRNYAAIICLITVSGCSNHPASSVIPKWEPKSKYGNPQNYQVFNKTYHVLKSSHGYKQQGVASWYGKKFHGKRTSSGKPYDMFAMTAAHKTLPLPTYAKVTNLDNGKHIVVKITDRGPFKKGRIIDLSFVAAKKLDIIKNGTGNVEVEAINFSPNQSKKKKNLKKEVYLQFGAFGTKSNALLLSKKLNNLKDLPKMKISIDEIERPGNNIFKVYVGPVKTEQQATILAKQISTSYLPKPVLVNK